MKPSPGRRLLRMHGNRCYVKLGRDPPNATCVLPIGAVLDHKFAESVSLSSTAPADFPLPGTALAFGFDLLGSRARRKEESRASSGDVQGVEDTSKPQFAEIQLSTCPQQTVQHVDNSLEQDATPTPPLSTG